MNGKKRKSKKLVLDSGKVNHFLLVSLTANHFNYEEIFYFKNLILIISHFFRKKLKRNESQKEDSFQI